jgi:hypothetical protein
VQSSFRAHPIAFATGPHAPSTQIDDMQSLSRAHAAPCATGPQ